MVRVEKTWVFFKKSPPQWVLLGLIGLWVLLGFLRFFKYDYWAVYYRGSRQWYKSIKGNKKGTKGKL